MKSDPLRAGGQQEGAGDCRRSVHKRAPQHATAPCAALVRHLVRGGAQKHGSERFGKIRTRVTRLRLMPWVVCSELRF